MLQVWLRQTPFITVKPETQEVQAPVSWLQERQGAAQVALVELLELLELEAN
jgi:hypothetical protein